MSNIIILTGYLCNGKTSMLPALKLILSSKFPDKKIITVNEPVRFLLEDVNYIFELNTHDFDFIQRQASFLATSLAQFDIIREFIYRDDYIVICDRCFVDPFVYTYLNYPKEDFENKRDELLKLLGLYNIELSFDFQFYYINLPEKYEVIEKCFRDNIRRETIDIDQIRENEEKFYEKYCLFVENQLDRYEHPADNSYVVYEIADEIISKLEE